MMLINLCGGHHDELEVLYAPGGFWPGSAVCGYLVGRLAQRAHLGAPHHGRDRPCGHDARLFAFSGSRPSLVGVWAMKDTITTIFAYAIWPIVVMIGPGILGDLNDSSKIGLFDRSYGSPFSVQWGLHSQQPLWAAVLRYRCGCSYPATCL